MEKTLKNFAKTVTKVFYGVGWVYCTLILFAVSSFADGGGAQAEAPADAVAKAPASAGDDGSVQQAIDERVELSRKVRQLHANLIKARADASSEDPEIDRMEKRIKALEAETSRIRAEMNDRIDKIPVVRAAQEEFDAAQKQLEEMNAKSRASGPRGRRVVRRKPDAVNRRRVGVEGGSSAVEEVQQEAGAVEPAAGSGE